MLGFLAVSFGKTFRGDKKLLTTGTLGETSLASASILSETSFASSSVLSETSLASASVLSGKFMELMLNYVILTLPGSCAGKIPDMLYSSLWTTYDDLKQLQNSMYFSFYM